MALSVPILSAEMMSASLFCGIGSKKFFDGLSSGIIRSIHEVALTTISFAGNAGSPGRAFILGIASSREDKLRPLVLQYLASSAVVGPAVPFLANAIAKTAFDLFSAATVVVEAVPGVANGTGVLSKGGIVMAAAPSKLRMDQEMVKQGLKDTLGNVTVAMSSITTAVSTALNQFLLQQSVPSIPVTGGSPSSGPASITMTGRFIV